VALSALAILLTPSQASPAGTIVIHGAGSGSHLRLTTRGSSIVVSGFMSRVHPAGCRLRRRHRVAVCPLAGEAAIELDMGPSSDKVEVLDKLPIGLVTYFGPGSDKLIGNGESDTCYPQGTRRNRCVGGAGNDVCITGPKNSDCVGGAGNDLCQANNGSDGCWGGPGRDVCYMGPGEDGCHGGGGDDRLFGGGGSDQLYGGPGFDYCDGGPGAGYSHECESGPRH
jgi:hypothetical protein